VGLLLRERRGRVGREQEGEGTYFYRGRKGGKGGEKRKKGKVITPIVKLSRRNTDSADLESWLFSVSCKIEDKFPRKLIVREAGVIYIIQSVVST